MARPRRKHALLALAAGGAALILARSAKPAPRREAGAGGRSGPPPRCRGVIVGAGFGGLQAALPLAGDPEVDLTVIDINNHHLFQPLLYQVATASLSPSDIAASLRTVIPVSDRSRILMASVTGLDTRERRVVCGDGRTIPYDELLIATGSRTGYFGHGEWARAAPGLKSLDDAVRLRTDILSALERAADTRDEAERSRLLTFVLIGAGPTGVEMAGAIAEMIGDVLQRDYAIPPGRARVLLVDAGHRVLAEFAPDLSSYTVDSLRRLGVEIQLDRRVTGIRDGEVELGGETVRAGTIVWTAGTEPTPVAEWLGVEPARGGRVTVDGGLGVPGHPEIHVIGDAAQAMGPDGRPYPGLASVAKQQGAYVAEVVRRRLRGRPAPAPFAFRDYGILATIGRYEAVAEFGPVHLTGRPAWLTWAVAHIAFLISYRNRVLVSAQWALAYATHQRGASLIVDTQAAERLEAQGASAAV